jgi:hypothetical protein
VQNAPDHRRGLSESLCIDIVLTINMSKYNATGLERAYYTALEAISDATSAVRTYMANSTSTCTPAEVSFDMKLGLQKSYQLETQTIGVLLLKDRIKLDAFPDPPSPPLRPSPSPPPPSPPPPSPPPGLPLPAALGAAIANLENLYIDPAAADSNSTGNGTSTQDSGSQLDDALNAVDQLTGMFGSLGSGVPLSNALLGSVANLVDSVVTVPAATGNADGEDGAEADDSTNDAADKVSAMLGAVGDAILQNMPVGAPPKTIEGDSFAMTVTNMPVGRWVEKVPVTALHRPEWPNLVSSNALLRFSQP